MIIIYFLSFISLILLILSGIQGLISFDLFGVNHAAFGFVAAIVYLFTEVLVMFFFVGTGVSIKEFIEKNELGNSSFHFRSIKIKRELYPPTLLNVFLVMTVFIIGGAVDTKIIPGWVHGILFYISFIHFLKVLIIQNKCFKDNTSIILDMTGLSK